MLQDQIKQAMLAKDTVKLSVLRAMKAAQDNVLTVKGRGNAPLTADENLAVIRKMIAQRNESIEAYVSAGREDKAFVERNERTILEGFLPTQLTDEELAEIVDQAIRHVQAETKRDTGKAIDHAKILSGGRADPKELSKLIASKLS